MSLWKRNREEIESKLQELEKLKETIEPLTKKIEQEKAVEILAKRRTAADRIQALRHEAEGLIEIQTQIDGLIEKLADIDRARQELIAAIAEKRLKLGMERGGTEGEIQREEEILYGSYNSGIDEAIQFFRTKLDYLRSPGRITHDKLGGQRDLIRETVIVTAESNADAVHSAIKYCMARIADLEKMKLEPELDPQKIEEMKTRIPPIDVYTEFTGERRLPGSRGM
jgi:DNA repair exonuclease SbcCD ATPase subunit